VNDKGLLAVANEDFTGSSQAERSSPAGFQKPSASALIGVPVSHFKKSPARRGSPTRGKARFCVAVGKRADDAALNCCNYDNNSTKMPRHFKSQSNASGCFQDHDFIKVTICIHINAEVIFRKHFR
jgi:hypothetical protein